MRIVCLCQNSNGVSYMMILDEFHNIFNKTTHKRMKQSSRLSYRRSDPQQKLQPFVVEWDAAVLCRTRLGPSLCLVVGDWTEIVHKGQANNRTRVIFTGFRVPKLNKSSVGLWCVRSTSFCNMSFKIIELYQAVSSPKLSAGEQQPSPFVCMTGVSWKVRTLLPSSPPSCRQSSWNLESSGGL